MLAKHALNAMLCLYMQHLQFIPFPTQGEINWSLHVDLLQLFKYAVYCLY